MGGIPSLILDLSVTGSFPDGLAVVSADLDAAADVVVDVDFVTDADADFD